MSLAMVFPGQGSQSVGMLADLAAQAPVVRSVFDDASHALDLDLWRLVQEGPEQQLNRTEITQPALLAAGYAVWQAWHAAGGPSPVLLAGHSLGEYTALVCAGVLEFTDAIRLVADRGRFMQEAVPAGVGAMAAILGLGDAQVIDVCRRVSGDQVVTAANFNCPGQVVIAGHAQAVGQAVELAKQDGARRAVILPVSVPSHCALMQAAADRLELRLQQVAARDARIPVVQNVDVRERTVIDEIRPALVQQLHQPVRWHACVERLRDLGVRHIVECGPGRVLSGLCRKIDRELNTAAVDDPASLQAALAAVPA